MKELECPNCHITLRKINEKIGVFFVCTSCNGRSAGMMLLRRLGMSWEYYDMLYSAGRKTPDPFAKLCPHCRKKMNQCKLPVGITLDVCGRCQQVWFDPFEFNKIPLKPEMPPSEEELPAECKEAIALAAIKSVERKTVLKKMKSKCRYDACGIFDDFYKGEGPEGWQWIPALLRLPVEIDALPRMKIPLVTWGLSAIMILVFLVQLIFIPENTFSKDFGFISGDWTRMYGLTVITSFFLHGGFFHLASNLYFFIIFGDNVEDRLGKFRFVMLLFFSHVAGLFLFSFLDSHIYIPTIGASGGIAGIIAYYAVCFPDARVGFFLIGYYTFYSWIEIPAVVAFLLFVALQCIGAYCQLTGYAGVNYLAHMGGLGIGFIVAVASHIIKIRKDSKSA